MLDDTYFMKQALSEAKKAYDKGEVPIGAVVVCNQQSYSKSSQSYRKLLMMRLLMLKCRLLPLPPIIWVLNI